MKEGLADRVEYVLDDYRNIDGRYDCFVSVGMLEHVGVDNYRELGEVIHRSLNPDGRGLIHNIGRNRPGYMHPWIERRIFPGAHPPALSEMMQIFETRRLSVLDVENLRPHYAMTLRHWLDRFERSRDQVRAMYDDRFVRMWRLYLAGSKAAFMSGELQLFQVLFARPTVSEWPLTRAWMYRDE
jgi:cyclopropane-fatty-acyl-phospholipid synthase